MFGYEDDDRLRSFVRYGYSRLSLIAFDIALMLGNSRLHSARAGLTQRGDPLRTGRHQRVDLPCWDYCFVSVTIIGFLTPVPDTKPPHSEVKL